MINRAIITTLILLLLIGAIFSYHEYCNLTAQINAINEEKAIIKALYEDSLVKVNNRIDSSIAEIDTVYLETQKKIYEKNIRIDSLSNDSLFKLFTAYTQDTNYRNRYIVNFKETSK